MRFLAFAAFGLVVAGALLWFLVMRDEGATADSKPPDVAPAPVKQEPSTVVPASRAKAARDMGSAMRAPTPSRGPASSNDSAAPVLPGDAGELAEKPSPYKQQLRDQVLATEQAIIDCNDKSKGKLDGLAAFSFTLARKGDKVVVESTGYEYNTIPDPAVAECMRNVAHQMKFDSLPDGADTVIGYRKVGVTNGAVVEHWMTEYSITQGPTVIPQP